MAVVFVLLASVAYFVSTRNEKQNDEIKVNNLTLKTSEVKYIPSLVQCIPSSAKNLEVRWLKSYLFPTFSNLPTDQVSEIKKSYNGATGLLILESQVRMTAKSGSSTINISELYKLNSNGKFIKALDTGDTVIKAGEETVTLYTYIPVDTNLARYDIEFCDSKSGIASMKLDFNSDAAVYGEDTIRINQNFTIAK